MWKHSENVFLNLIYSVEASPFFSPLINELTDVSNHEKSVAYVTSLNEFKPLRKNNVQDGKAATISTALKLRKKTHV